MFETMREHLNSTSNNKGLRVNVRHAARAALEKLMFYYDIIRKNHFNIIATSKSYVMLRANCSLKMPVCHPGLRDYFEKLGADRAEEARTILGHIYREYQSAHVTTAPPDCPKPVAPTSSETDTFLAAVAKRDEHNHARPQRAAKPELDRYVQDYEGGLVLTEPLKWWKVRTTSTTL